MMNNFEQLFEGWVAGTLTKEEVNRFLDQLPEQEVLMPELIDGLLKETEHSAADNELLREKLFSRITVLRDPVQAPVRKLSIMKWAIAAAVVILAGCIWWYSLQQNSEETPSVVINTDQKLMPGGDKAVLVLSNGDRILLDSSADGRLAQQQGATIYKSGTGQIDYKSDGSQAGTTEKISFNTLSTPRGGQYKLTLPDGTKVWLNAASSITYPTKFNSSERSVSVTGEVYFEVEKMMLAHSKTRMPFKVKVPALPGSNRNDMEVYVLGTHFNVNAYADEPVVSTTLMEGSIQLKHLQEQYLLQPGQQAQLEGAGRFRILSEINAEEVLAWKNGFFYFEHTKLPFVMRQIARWYDVVVEYRGEIPEMQFGGEIPRNANLEDVLKILQATKLKFVVEGKKIIVIP